PSCSPLRIWTARRVMDMGDPQRAVISVLGEGDASRRKSTWLAAHPARALCSAPPRELRLQAAGTGAKRMRRTLGVSIVGSLLRWILLGGGIGVGLDELVDDLGLDLAVGALGAFDQVEVLDGIVVGVELEASAQRLEIRLHYGGAQGLPVSDVALD